MNEIILAYGLGVVSVGVLILMRVVLRADKKVTELEQVIENSMRDHETSIQDVYRQIETVEREIAYQNQELDRKIDSRIDKLDFRITDQLNYIKSKSAQDY
jgi:predicted Holliday junction resolvase-like endonuclease